MLRRTLIILFLIIGLFPAEAQTYQCDTLEMRVLFRRDRSDIDTTYMDNASRLDSFHKGLNSLLADSSAVVRYIVIRTSASPEGPVDHNLRLSESRAQSIESYLTRQMGMDPYLFRFEPVGEDWEGLERMLASMNCPQWVSEALEIISDQLHRKSRLQRLEGGKAWEWMDENLFPELRAAGGSVKCVIQRPVRISETVSQTDTVYVPVVEARTDTVYAAAKKAVKDLSDRKMLLAVRTNVLAVPLANIGVEVPLNSHWSLGADWYYPWIWRDDVHQTCNQLLALDIEARYWFRRKDMPENQRLAGHSIGIYAAAGYYDFERNWTGHQGEFVNAGIDYLYSLPIFRGRMHLEFELGFGYILSAAQPYDCFEAGGKCYRRKGVMKYIHWVGPTRAQASLMIPFHARRKGGAE